MNHPCTAAALVVSMLALGCRGDASTGGPPTRPMPERVASIDDVVSVVVPPDLIVHRQRGVVQGVSGDGTYRLHVERLRPDLLIRLAAASKDAWTARGWEVTGEQHFERALFAAMRRGGSARNPRERREVWWSQGDRAVTLCDVIALSSRFDRLGEPVRAGCQTIEAAAWPADG